jgi:hypothetical protein
MKQYIYAATIPIQLDGPHAPATDVPITLLAANLEEAKEQAEEAGFTLIGQLDTEGKLIKS